MTVAGIIIDIIVLFFLAAVLITAAYSGYVASPKDKVGAKIADAVGFTILVYSAIGLFIAGLFFTTFTIGLSITSLIGG